MNDVIHLSKQEAYQVYRADKTEQGAAFADYACDVLALNGIFTQVFTTKQFQYQYGESAGGIEFKCDMKFRESGNLYIEIAEKAGPRSGEMVPSGIMRDDNTWLYAIGDLQGFYVFTKNTLRLIHSRGRYNLTEIETSKGMLLPIKAAVAHAKYFTLPL